MKYYLKIFFALINESTKAYLEHRWNTFGNVFNTLINLFLIIFFVEIVFSQTALVYSWTKYEILFLVGVYQVVAMLSSALFYRNLTSIPTYIQRGSLDVFLTKPLNGQFLISLRYIRVQHFLSAIPGLLLMIYSISKMNFIVLPFSILLLFINIFSGLLIIYSLFFLFSCLSFWLVKFSALAEFYNMLYRPLSLPVDIFGNKIASFLTFIIPLAFVVTIPSKIFLGKIPEYFSFWCLIVAAICLLLSRWFWNFALKHYTSASS